MFNDKLLKLSLAVIVFLIIMGFTAINFMLKEDVSVGSQATNSTPKKTTLASTSENEVSLDTIFINIQSEKFKMMKTDIALVMKDKKGKKALMSDMENVRNAVLRYLNSMDSNGLDTPKGKDRLKSELMDMIQEKFGYEVETIYFKNFLLAV